MTLILDTIRYHAINSPGKTALMSGVKILNYSELHRRIEHMAMLFMVDKVHVIAVHLDNGIDWVLIDLAAQSAGVILVPIPLFFSSLQIKHVLDSSGADTIISFSDEIVRNYGVEYNAEEISSDIWRFRLKQNYIFIKNRYSQTEKITFTSGTTGNPKGVRLANDSIMEVAKSLVKITSSIDIQSHLCLLPLATLLENIAGIYAPLLKGASCQLPSLAETGLTGSTQFDARKMLDCLNQYQPHSIILLPQMLFALVDAIQSGINVPACLKFIAVGGGRVSPAIINKARDSGLPVYEGYGLSECGSVVALNTPEHNRVGSAGKVLPHIEIKIADDQEVMVKGNFMQGYLGGPLVDNNEWMATGDLGGLDDDGFLYINGRKKNIFITSFGRNVSPEWTESELTSSVAIHQAVVFGEARPANCAVIVPVDEHTEDRVINNAITRANRNLPDYAGVHYWVRANENFNIKNGLATANGRPLRNEIYRFYESEINNCYEKQLISGSA